jgi:hypothetical protein
MPQKTQEPGEEHFELQLRGDLDLTNLKAVATIVKRHNLRMRESPSRLVIYESDAQPMEIVA